MQPLKLTMKNIGPFLGIHVVDFTALDKIFLISGKTGAGKTTILDALTYALYGALPGARKTNDKRHLRSDFCSSQEECSISLDFLRGGRTYRVERTLPFMYTTRNATQREEGETATLYEKTPLHSADGVNGDLFLQTRPNTVLTAQKSETDNALKLLMGLSLDEFSRIVLLPQGEFAVFLRQNSNDRKIMLSKLFPVEQFSRITEKLKEHKGRHSASLEALMVQLDFLQQTYNPDTADTDKKDYAHIHDTIKKMGDKNQTKMFEIKGKVQRLKDQAIQYTEFKHITAQLDTLLIQDEHITLDTKRLELSNEAIKIAPLIQVYKKAQTDVQKLKDDLSRCSTHLVQCTNDVTNFTVQIPVQESHKKRISELEILLYDLDGALDSEHGLREAKTRLTSVQTKLLTYTKESKRISESIQVFDALIDGAGDVQDRYDRACEHRQIASLELLFAQDAVFKQEEIEKEHIYTNAKLILKDFVAEDTGAKIAHQAASLVLNLHEGEACPVCGSTEHPKRAVAPRDMIGIEEKIKTQEQLVAQCENALLDIRGRRQKLAGSIEESKKNVLDYTEQAGILLNLAHAKENEEKKYRADELAQTDVQEKDKILQKVHAARDQKEKLKKDLDRVRTQEQPLELDIARATTQRDHAQNEMDKIVQKACTHSDVKIEKSLNTNDGTDIAHIISVRTLEKKELIQKTKIFETEHQQHTEQLVRLKERSESLTTNLTNCKNHLQTIEAELHTALIASPFIGIDQPPLSGNENERDLHIKRVEEALLDRASQEAIKTRRDFYKNEKLRLETIHKEKKSSLHGNPDDIAQKIEDVRIEEEDLQGLIDTTNDELTHAQEQITRLDRQTKEYVELEKRRKEISVELEGYTSLYNAVSGNNPKKIPLDSWILGMYLEEITKIASQRLERISDSRYTMYLKSETEGGRGYKGLDLEIYDAHTGKKRPCSTLSGGETFMASISLALAISDTVQARNGGIELDSLFIDEGFGSLDTDALEKALGILDEIRETRSIGLISHVDSLKHRIPSQIKITKIHAGGSTITIN